MVIIKRLDEFSLVTEAPGGGGGMAFVGRVPERIIVKRQEKKMPPI